MTHARSTTPNVSFGLFTCADTVGQNQFNAWGSWKTMPACSVSVFGDAAGVAGHARRFGFRSLAALKRDDFGRPLLSSIFERMHEESTESVLGYVNSDIVILPGLSASIAAARAHFDEFLLVARRWNVEELPALRFEPGWAETLGDAVLEAGELFTPFGIDLFVFSRGLLREVPPFALGSDYWDNYLLMRTRRRGVPVVDVTRDVMLVHQNHSLGKYRSAAERRRGPEGLRAFALAGDSHAMLGQTRDATHVLVRGELERSDTAYVTAVLPHRGAVRRLCRCLRALEYQSYPQSFLNTIVVNGDPEAPLRYLEADFPSTRVVTAPRFVAAAVLNKGVSCATAGVVALFDSDLVPAPDCLERVMRTLATEPAWQIAVCRIDPLFLAGKASYLGRAVEWFDAVAHYDRKDWLSYAGACATGAFIVRKEVFEQHGYYSDVHPELASDNWEWAKRMLAAGVKVTFCRDAVVRHETVRNIAELKRKKQRTARCECIASSLRTGKAYGLTEILRDTRRELGLRLQRAWQDERIPARYRVGVLLVALWAAVWALSAKLGYRHQAERVVRRHRRALARARRPATSSSPRRVGLPFRWLANRFASRRSGGEAPALPAPNA